MHAEYNFFILSVLRVPGRWDFWETWLGNYLFESCTLSPLVHIIPTEKLFALFVWLRLYLSNCISDTFAFFPLSVEQSLLCNLVLKVGCLNFGAGKYYEHVFCAIFHFSKTR